MSTRSDKLTRAWLEAAREELHKATRELTDSILLLEIAFFTEFFGSPATSDARANNQNVKLFFSFVDV